MTIQELIDQLQKINDKQKEVLIQDLEGRRMEIKNVSLFDSFFILLLPK